MTRDEVVMAFARTHRFATNPESHPGFTSFCTLMIDRQYGDRSLVIAWSWYRKGWDDLARSMTELLNNLSERNNHG